MAKTDMVCPFSNKMCKDCVIYRGRHYFMCFNKNYRGHLDESTKINTDTVNPHSGFSARGKFEMPEIKSNSRDPFAITIKEREAFLL